MIKYVFLMFVCLFVSTVVYAEPAVTSASGSFTHGSTVTIAGSGFGAKNPVAPLLWDDGTSNPPLSTYYDAWLPTQAQQGSYYNMSYRQVPFRGVSAPHNRISYILGGAHATNDVGYPAGGTVGIGKNITSHNYFVSYYYRIDPFYDVNNAGQGDNLKEFVLSGVANTFYTDSFPPGHGYVGECNPPDLNHTGDLLFGRVPITPAYQSAPYSCSGNNLVYHDSPINGWVNFQWEGVYNATYNAPQIALTTFANGHRKRMEISHYGDPLTVGEYARGFYPGYPKQNDLRFIGIGGFARTPRMNNGVNSFRYFAAVYMDNTRARVMLGNNPDYNSCTIMEPQIPSSWNNNSITIKMNFGRLPDTGTAYLFVFDVNNNRNLQGYPVALGGTVVRDTMSPAAPLNPK